MVFIKFNIKKAFPVNEIAYVINPSLTLEQGLLVLDLLEVKKEGVIYHPFSSHTRLVSQWRSLARLAADQEAFAFLLKEELFFQQKMQGRTPHLDSFSLAQIHISPAQTLHAFQLLSLTQKLYCQGKQLIVDLFGKTYFYYEANSLNTGALEIEGKLRWRDTTVTLEECEALGPGKPHHWFVRNLTLRLIHTTISWKKLQELKRSHLLLEGGAKHSFLEDLDPADPEAPQLIMKEGSEGIHEQNTPYPILKLKDRWGACADLWMDYGSGQLVPIHDPRALVKDHHQHVRFKRQLEVEATWERDLLETDFIKKNVGSSHYYCPLDCVAKSLTFLLEVGWHIEDWQERRVIKQTDFALEMKEGDLDTIAIHGHLQYDTYKADLSQVLGAFNRREHFIQLSSDRVGLLPVEETQRIMKDLAEESEWVGGEGKIKKACFGALSSLFPHATLSASLDQLKDQLQNFNGIQEALPSSHFQGQLRPYQQQGVNWLNFLYEYGFHGILADEMGLGKTVQVLAFLSRLPRGGPHLIVMPTSLLFNWRNELQQFLPSWTSLVHQGPQRTTRAAELLKVDVILTSYPVLRMDLSLLQSISYSCIILDEAQMIKNAHTQTSQSVCQLQASLRLCLTGTPVENRLQELWSHFHFLIPSLFDSLENFEANLLAAQSDRRYLDRIKRKIAPFLLRRRKQDVVADLPPRMDQMMWIDMADEQRAYYDQLLKGFKNGILKKVKMEGVGKHRIEIFEALLRLRQICCHPLLVSASDENPVSASAKFDALLQDLETLVEENHKVLIYSQFTSMLRLMTQAADERHWSYGYLDGNTNNREEVVTSFQKDSTQCLFFISLKAGGVGLNLTAADYVYLYDPWWNEAVEEQAIHRAHRIGRENPVIAKRLIIRESIEEKIMKLKAAKRLMIEDLLNAETAPFQLTLEDFEYLFS